MADLSQNKEVVITDENGIEYIFPPGTDPQAAFSAMRNLHSQADPQGEGRLATERLLSGQPQPQGASVGRAPNWLEKTVGALPEIGGTTAGALAGAPLGPVGAAAGAMVGAGGGEALRQILASLNIAPKAFGTIESARPERIQESMMYGGLAEAGGQALSKIPLSKILSREARFSPRQASDIRILEREGIPYSAGDVHQGPGQIAENLMRGTLLGSGPAGSFETTQRLAVAEFQDRVLNKLGPFMTKEELGEGLQAAVKGRHQKLVGEGGVFERAYQRVSAIFPAKVNTAKIRQDVAPIKAELDKLTSEGRIGAAAKSKENPSRYVELVNNLASFGTTTTPAQPPSAVLDSFGNPMRAATEATKKEIPLTYKDVWKDKQSLDAVIRSMGTDDPLRTRAKGDLKRLHSILDSAMEEAAQKNSPQAANRIRNINKAYAETKRLFETESPVAKIGDIDPEKVFQRFFQPGSTTPPRQLMKALEANPEMLPPMRRRFADNLFEGIGREVDGVHVTPAGQLRQRIAKSKDTMKVLFKQDQIDALNEFVNASERAQSSGRMINPASGRQLLAASQIGEAGKLATLGARLEAGLGGVSLAFGNIAGAGAVVVGPAVLSRALFNPKIARLLAKGFTLPPGTAEYNKWALRSINAVRSIESQDNKP